MKKIKLTRGKYAIKARIIGEQKYYATI